MTTTSSVQNLFTLILRRDGTTEEVANFVAVINEEFITLAQAQQVLLESTEVASFVDPVVRLYQSAFGRQPDPDGFDDNVQFLRDGGTVEQLSDVFSVAVEFTNRFSTGTTVDSAFLAGMYQNVLNRLPVVSEIDFWIATGEDRGGVLRGFSESPEYIVNSQADVDRLLNKVASGIPLDPTKSLAETPGGPIANLSATASMLVAENSTMVTDGFDGTDTSSNIGGVDGSLFDDEEGDDTLIQLDANDSVTLIGVSLGDLNSGDVLI